MQAHLSDLVKNTSGGVEILHAQQKSKILHKRLPWVDYARGMAIMLVVYRHTMVGLNRAGDKVPDFLYYIQEFVLNFRMPVFFILSGIFLSAALEKYPVKELVAKKVLTLLYPYLLWTVILITMQVFLSNYTNSQRTIHDYLYILIQPRELDHMWYLLALFNTSILFLFSYKLLRNYPFVNIAIGLILHFSYFLIRDYSLFSDLFYYYIFLVAGFLFSKPLLTFEEKETAFFGKAFIFILPFFVAGQLLWLKEQPETYLLSFPFLAIILTACSFFYVLCRFLQKIGFAPWFTQVGKHSLYIYILHIFVISSFRILTTKILGITNIYFLVGGSLVLGVLLPLLAYRIFSSLGMWYLFSLEKPKPSNINR